MNNAVNFELYDEVMLITLDRPKANAIDAETSHMLGEVFIRFCRSLIFSLVEQLL